MYFTTEVKTEGNYPKYPTEIIGINTNAITTIIKSDDNSIRFFVGGSSSYTKLFNSEQERDDYFNYLATKLEIIEFIKVEGHDYSGKKVSTIINFDKVTRVDKGEGSSGSYGIFIKIDGGQTGINFKNMVDANQYYDWLMGKLRAFEI